MKKPLIAFAISSILYNVAHADTVSTAIHTDQTGKQSYHATLSGMKITLTPFSQKMGTQQLTAQDIKHRPTGNGNLSELLKTNPNARYANRTDSSNTAGEIAPDEVSIHGAKFYENNYTIDGLSNNDNIHPGANNGHLSARSPDGYSPTDLPAGGTQSFWLDSSLMKNVEIFDSNVSAKYGQFTGGLINANIKDPDSIRSSGRVWYRTTRDDWANLHITEDDLKDGFYEASSIAHQPRFTKQQYGVEINQPISHKTAVLLAYNKSESVIPYYDNIRTASQKSGLQTWQKQRRVHETYLLKGTHKFNDQNIINATLMYAPHQNAYPKQGIKDGFFTNTGGGYRANLEWHQKNTWGKMTSYLGYRKTGNEVEHESDSFHNYIGNYAGVDSFEWCSTRNRNGVCGFARLGGYGTFKTQKESYTLKQDFDFKTLGSTIKHNISTGWQFDHAKASYERERDAYAYSRYATARAGNLKDCTDCITDKQYAVARTYYPARSIHANDNSFSHYIEDSMTYKNLNVVLGLRSDYSAYWGNINIAPRLSFTYDVFGDKRTRMFGGANRYYAGSMLAHKLRNGIALSQNQERTLTGNTLSDWTTRSTSTGSATNSYDISQLDTPYDDELSFGVAQEWGNNLWTLKWVRRDGKDQLVRQTVYNNNRPSHQVLSNDGTSKTQNLTLSVNSLSPTNIKGVADVSWSLGASYQKSQSNNTYYDAVALDALGIEKAIYRDKLIDIDEVPQVDFNTPWTSFVTVNTHFPKLNLNWSQRLSYTDGYRSLRRSQRTCSDALAGCGDYAGDVYVYALKDNPNAFKLDWRFEYKFPLKSHQSLDFNIDINNVLNKPIMGSSPTGSSSATGESHQMGRNFWLGATYNW